MTQDDIDNDLPFERQREFKQPLVPDDDSTTGFTLSSGGSMTYRGGRYVCPRCGGTFSSWDSPKDQYKHIGQEKYSHRKRDKFLCPFCGLERGQYDPDDEIEELRRTGRDGASEE